MRDCLKRRWASLGVTPLCEKGVRARQLAAALEESQSMALENEHEIFPLVAMVPGKNLGLC